MSDNCTEDVTFYAPKDTFGGVKPVPSCLPGEDRIPPELTTVSPKITEYVPGKVPGPIVVGNRAVITACSAYETPVKQATDTVYNFYDTETHAYGKIFTTAEKFYTEEFYITDLKAEISESVLNYIAENVLEKVIEERLTANSIAEHGELTINEIVSLTRLSNEAATELFQNLNDIKNRLTENVENLNIRSIECYWENGYQIAKCVEPEGGADYLGNKYYAKVVTCEEEDFRIYSGIPQSNLAIVLDWLKSQGITAESPDIKVLIRDIVPQQIRNGKIKYQEIKRLMDVEATKGQFGITEDYAMFQYDADLPPAKFYADPKKVETAVISYAVPAGSIKSSTSQEDADTQARIMAESMLNCVYTNEPVTVECRDLPDYPEGSFEADVPTEYSPVYGGLVPRVGTYTVVEDIVLSTTSTSLATTAATTMALGMLVCYYVNHDLFITCYDPDGTGVDPQDEDKKRQEALMKRRARNVGVIPTATNWAVADPSGGTKGQEVFIPAGFFTSTVSEEEADELARNFAASLLECCYVNEPITITCPECIVIDVDGNEIVVPPMNTDKAVIVIEEGRFSSCESQDEANELARAEAMSLLDCYYGNPKIMPTCMPQWALDGINSGDITLPLSKQIAEYGTAAKYIADPNSDKLLYIPDLPITALDGVSENTFVVKDDCQTAYNMAQSTRKKLNDRIDEDREICLYANDEFIYGCVTYDLYNEFGLRVSFLNISKITNEQAYALAGFDYKPKRDCCNGVLDDDNLGGMWSMVGGGGFYRAVILYKKVAGELITIHSPVLSDPNSSWYLDVEPDAKKYANIPALPIVGEEPMERWVFTNKVTGEADIIYKKTVYTATSSFINLDYDYEHEYNGSQLIGTYPRDYYSKYFKSGDYYIEVTDMDGYKLSIINPTANPYKSVPIWPAYKVGKKASGNRYFITTMFENELSGSTNLTPDCGCSGTSVTPSSSGKYTPTDWTECNTSYRPLKNPYKERKTDTQSGLYNQDEFSKYIGNDTSIINLNDLVVELPTILQAGEVTFTNVEIAQLNGIDVLNVTAEYAKRVINQITKAQVDAIMSTLVCTADYKPKKEIWAACEWKRETVCGCGVRLSALNRADAASLAAKRKCGTAIYPDTLNEEQLEKTTQYTTFALPYSVWFASMPAKKNAKPIKTKCCKVMPRSKKLEPRIVKLALSGDCFTCADYQNAKELVTSLLECEIPNRKIVCKCKPPIVCFWENRFWPLIWVPAPWDTNDSKQLTVAEGTFSAGSEGEADNMAIQFAESIMKASAMEAPMPIKAGCCGIKFTPIVWNSEYTATCAAWMKASGLASGGLLALFHYTGVDPDVMQDYAECEAYGGATVAVSLVADQVVVPEGTFHHCVKPIADARAKALGDSLIANMCVPSISYVKNQEITVKCCAIPTDAYGNPEPPSGWKDPRNNWPGGYAGEYCVGPESITIPAGMFQSLCVHVSNQRAWTFATSIQDICQRGFNSHAMYGRCEEEFKGWDWDKAPVIDVHTSIYTTPVVPEGFAQARTQQEADDIAQAFADSLCIQSQTTDGKLYGNTEQVATCDSYEYDAENNKYQKIEKQIKIPANAVLATTQETADSLANTLASNIVNQICQNAYEPAPDPYNPDPPDPPGPPNPPPPPPPPYEPTDCCKDTYKFNSDWFTVKQTPQSGTKCSNYSIGVDEGKVKQYVAALVEKTKVTIETNGIVTTNQHGVLHADIAASTYSLGGPMDITTLVHY